MYAHGLNFTTTENHGHIKTAHIHTYMHTCVHIDLHKHPKNIHMHMC